MARSRKRGQKCDESKNVYVKSLKFSPEVREKKVKDYNSGKERISGEERKKIQFSVKRIHEHVGVIYVNFKFFIVVFARHSSEKL